MKKLLIVSAAALIDGDGRVLLAQRPQGDPYEGLWEFPGGKLETGETPEAALIRELQEELDINVDASCLSPVAFSSLDLDDFHLLMPLFVCRKWSGRPKAKEANALKWVRPNELLASKMPPADIPLAAQLRDLL